MLIYLILDPMESTLTNISDKTAEQDAIYKMDLDYETDEDNVCVCRGCFKEFSTLEALQRHKLSFCRQQTGTSDYETDEENSSLRGVCFEEFSTLEEMQRHKLSSCRQQTGTSDYETDEDNSSLRGVCFEEFSTLEVLQRHELSSCRQQTPTSDKDTTAISLALYRYLCEKIVGTESHVKTIRLMNNIWDNMISSKHLVSIISGSFGEGLLMRGSDLTVITISKSIEVNADENKRLDPNISCFRMDTEDVKPGFTHLLAENYSRTFLRCYEEINGKLYLSSTLLKRYLFVNRDTHIIHGPCLSDKFGLIDDSMCLHCKTWISQASQWISRSSNSWPSNDVKQSIIKHGVLFLPIGVKGSFKEDIEWRISFSVGEKMLISTFTHTQLLCYALLKIVLKDVIAMNAECKDLLCSYHLKTIIFWISEELPQSIWKPDNLIPCFKRCFSRLIYCVEYSSCLHYFIPENNMFEDRIEGRARRELLNTLYTLRCYDWRCVLLSDQLTEWRPELMVMDDIALHTLHLIEVKKTLYSEHLYWPNFMDFNIRTCTYKRNLHRLLVCDKSAVKYLHTYYLSRWCAQYAQSISLTFTRSNKLQYKQYTSCLCTLLQNIHHDAVSGWLMLASLFYKSKQYQLALFILRYSLSKFTSEKLYRFMEMSDIHYRLLKLISFQKKIIVRIWKILLVDDITFHRNCELIPDELQMEVESGDYFVSSIVYCYFLTFLCHYHLNNVRQCHNAIEDLEHIIREKYLIGKDKTLQYQVYRILRIASHLLWNRGAARQAVKKRKTLIPNLILI
ncbi:uncharacterized protein LOC134690214 [Mytilus trossulus]|uniref:uncharacterized protein LOC134690214 n=1 Tax=Mytilus trossulus TaxID=6551 RepID=UPI00300726F1